ncbi:type II toxin-antitoxin system VapC family toxin [Candidatus Gottesmanbacteria bacterium]|nr:type II toxin-antitoxin system VapC family toxin [Candidatus Gottesmanbacteria bacterium]
MEIAYLPTLIPFLKNKHLLLDTNVFRDAVVKPAVYSRFFNELKNADVTLATIDFVRYELLKGSADDTKYKEKEKFINDIVDITIPVVAKTMELVYTLIQRYGIHGTAINITDLLLGATLMQYQNNICLLTRDTTDFIQTIFDLSFIVNIPYAKGIFTYGVYQYVK